MLDAISSMLDDVSSTEDASVSALPETCVIDAAISSMLEDVDWVAASDCWAAAATVWAACRTCAITPRS
ncbi:hypothetical protein D3C72_2019710 [compost metagenome]